MTFKTAGTCAKSISFDIVEGNLHNVKFEGGCSGNLQAISILVEGMNAQLAVSKLKGLNCGQKTTSCSDQLTKAIEQARTAGGV